MSKFYALARVMFKSLFKLVFITFVCSGIVQATVPAFSAVISPDTLGPGNLTTLTFTITNSDASGIRNASFTNTLPAGVVYATPSNAQSTCLSGSLSAPGGGGTLTFSGYDIPVGSCTVSVDIIASTTAGEYVNNSGDLTSDEGNSGGSTDTLSVVSTLPGYTMALSSSPINQGAISTLTQTIDNTANDSTVDNLDFTLNLPSGLKIADEPNASTTCGTSTLPATLTANAGSTVITLDANGVSSFPAVAAGETCSVITDVKATGIGSLNIRSTSLQASFVDSGGAQIVLTSTQAFALVEFQDNPTTPGATTSLNFTLTNYSRSDSLTNIAFTDDLNAALSGLLVSGDLADPCGAGSSVTGDTTTTLTFSGGSLAPEASCSFSVPVTIPASAATGSYTNTISTFAMDLGGSSDPKPAVSNNLSITKAPTISVTLSPNPVASGGEVTASFTIDNIDTVNAATDIAYTADLTAFTQSFPVTATLPAAGFCGGGASMALVSSGSDQQSISMTAGSLAASGQCTFDVVITMPPTSAPGTYSLVTDAITATITATTVTGQTTSATTEVLTAPALAIGFADTAVDPGTTIDATFTLSHSSNADTATAMAFTTDFNAALAGLTFSSLNSNDCGGAVTGVGTTSLGFTGGTVTGGSSCSIGLTLQLPAGGASSTITVTSSAISADVSGTTYTSPAVTGDFNVVTLAATMSFDDNDADADNNAVPGNTTATLDFNLTNNSTNADGNILFTVDLNGALSTLASSSGAFTGCNGSISGTTFLVFSGGSLAAGASCNFSVTVTVPAGAADGIYNIVTSSISSDEGTVDPMTVAMTVEQDLQPSIVSIVSAQSPSTSISPIAITIEFSENIENFTVGDLTVSNGSASNLVEVNASQFTADITPAADGDVTVELLAGVVEEEGAGVQTNTASSVFTIDYDSAAFILPSAVIAAPSASTANTGPVTFGITYSNATIIDLTAAKISIIGSGASGTISVSNGSTATPTVTLSSITGDGTLGISIAALSARNSFGDVMAITDSSTFTVDNTNPDVTITSAVSDPTNSAFVANFNFNEVVTGFDSTDVVLNNANISGFSGTGASYSATISPIANGNVTIDINANSANDGHGNGNNAATQFSVTNDISAPTGFAVDIDTAQSFINGANDTAFRFSYSGAELTSQYSYTITDGSTTSTPVTGTISSASGSFTGIDVSIFNEGTLTLSFTLTDVAGNTGGPSTDTIVKQINDAPVITEGAVVGVTMSEDASPTMFSLTLNATDPESETITWSISSAASNGTATTSGTGTSKVINYSPTSNYNGSDSFTVEITDNNGLEPLTDSIVVNVTISPENDQPVIDSTSVLIGAEDLVYVYNITTDDIDTGDSHAISASTLPGWLTLSDAGDGTAVLTGTPLNDDVGSNAVTLVVTDNSGAGNNSNTQSFNISVSNTNDAPVIDSTSITVGTEDSVYTYSILTSDVDTGDTRAITATTLPSWLTLTDNGNGTATLTGTPLNADVGANAVVIVVTDAATAADSQSYSISVANTNDAPVIDSAAVTTGSEDNVYTYNIVTSDVDSGDTRAITASTLPGWLTLTDNGNGTATLMGTPFNANVGANAVVIVVTDAATATDSQSYTVTVANTNDAPVIDSTAVTVASEDSVYSYNIVTSDVDTGDTRAITATTLPSWLTLTDNGNGTATLTGTPLNADVGANAVVIVVTDAATAADSQSYSISVANTNDAPVIDSAAVTAGSEDTVYTYNIVTSDVDTGDTRAITATTLPSWLTLTDNGNGTATLTGTPLNADVGASAVVIVVTDAATAADTQSYSISVANTNDAPVIDSSAVTAGSEDNVYTYNIVTSDIDNGDTRAITATTLPGWLTLTDNGNGTATLTGTPLNADVGANAVVIVVTDAATATDSQSYSITVSNTNDAPVIDSSAVTVASEDSVYTYSIVTSDVDTGDTRTITATTLPSWLTLTDNGNGTATLTGTPVNADVGANAVVILVTDAATATDTQSYSINVANTNDAPVIDSAAVIVASEDSVYTYSIVTSDVDTGDTRTITATTLPSWLTITDNGNGTATLTGTPLNADVGTNGVVIVVTDAGTLIDTQSFDIVVANTNDAPVIDSIAVTGGSEDAVYTYNIATSDVDTGDTRTIIATTLPSWLTLTDNGNGTATLIGTPLNINIGANSVEIVVTDAAALTDTQTFSILVNNTNDAPVIDSTAVVTGDEDAVYSYNIVTSDVDTGDTRYITAPTLPSWLALTDNGDGTATLMGTPLNANVGNNAVVILVTDTAGATDSQSFTITVVNTDDEATGQPVIAGILLRAETLSIDTSSISDEDGLGSFNYQWQRAGLDVVGATNSTYLLGEADVWQTLKVVVSFNDGGGNLETLMSLATGEIFDLDSDGDGIYDLEEGTEDSDGDGIPDYLDDDSDNDGIPDSEEGNGDSDGDGIADYLDTSIDEDGDGIPDILEGNVDQDTDGDGVNDAFDTDSDNDGISDFEESGATGLDSDDDGIDDAFDVDITGGIDANNDGIDDDVAPLDSDNDGIPDYLDRDSDNDSIPDALENNAGLQLKKSSVSMAKLLVTVSDTDGDGVKDYLDLDSDEDGISDLAEAATSIVDSDLDQIIDEFDVDFTGGLDSNLDGVDDAAALQNSDNDITQDMFDLDSDNDGINDVIESGSMDEDLNGLTDTPLMISDLPLDSDNDSTPDYRDLDSNDDGFFDIKVSGAATLDNNADGQIDDNYADVDSDGDGIIEVMDDEPNQFGTSPDRDRDGIPSATDLDDDGDGISDLIEGVLDTDGDNLIDSLDSDSDNDGLSDMFESDRPAPTGSDADRDGIDDAFDVDVSGGVDADMDGVDDIFMIADTDGDGIADYLDKDSDNDGIPDKVEQLSVVLSNFDDDLDGLDNAVDVDETQGIDSNADGQDDSTLILDDIDGDGLLGYRDTDTDGDGIPDSDENGDYNNNGINDRLEAEVEVTATSGGGSFGIIILLMSILLIGLRKKEVMRKFLVVLLGVFTLNATAGEVCSTNESDVCWYLGVGAGHTQFNPVSQQTSWGVIDDDDNGYRVFAGFDFKSNWFAELGYNNLGDARLNNRNPMIQTKGRIDYSASELALGYRIIPLSKSYSVNFKLGVAELKTDSNFISDESDSVSVFGFGVKWNRDNNKAVSLNYDRYGEDVYMISLNLHDYF